MLVALLSSITHLFVLLAVHGIRSSHLQHHNSKLSILLLSAFLIVQDSQPYRTTGKINAITILHFVVIVISLCFHILFSPVIAALLITKKAIRIITSSHYIAHTDPLFAMTKLLKLEDLYKYQLGIFMHKVTHSQLPQNMSSLFLRTDKIHSHKLRNQNAYYIQQILQTPGNQQLTFLDRHTGTRFQLIFDKLSPYACLKRNSKSFYRASILRMVNCNLAVITNF